MDKPLADPDPTGTHGSPYLKAAAWWLIGAGVLLLLPRQWPSAGIAFGLGLLLHTVVAWRRRDAEPHVPPAIDARE